MTIRHSHLTLSLAALAAAVLYNVWYFVLGPVSPAGSRPAAEQPLVGPTGPAERAVARPVVPAPVPVRPAVRTILYSADRRLAIVDGRIVGVGDAVGDYTVVDIEKGAVVFMARSGERLRVPVHPTAADEVAR